MSYKKKYAKFRLPVKKGDVKFYRSKNTYAVTHIKIPRSSGSNKSVCGITLDNKTPANKPQVIADLCTRCLKNQYSFFEQDLPFQVSSWVKHFNFIAREGTTLKKDELNIYDIIEQQLEEEFVALSVQNEIYQCNHLSLIHMMRYNHILSLTCHNCQKVLTLEDCLCDEPYILEIQDRKNDEEAQDIFCINCNGFVFMDTYKFK